MKECMEGTEGEGTEGERLKGELGEARGGEGSGGVFTLNEVVAVWAGNGGGGEAGKEGGDAGREGGRGVFGIVC